MTTTRSPDAIGILGGTFDPIHIGHLRLGEEALQQLGLDQIRFIPAGRPPLRDVPSATPEQRLAMVKLSIADNPDFGVDDSEVMAATQSYTVETLERLRLEFGAKRPLVLLLGQDAFGRLESWHRWTEIFSLAHVAVATRPNSPVGSDVQCRLSTADPLRRRKAVLCETPAPPPLNSAATSNTQVKCASALAREFQQRLGTATDLASSPFGRIVPFTIPTLDISATAIRRQIKSGTLPRYLVAEAVVRYIESHYLYR
ncbi:MAG: nicotinate-nucleotide adenylyltransferase [Rhodocyclaceae bacterium]|nr:nicotinate (nicotinamide) nucleotide adenylyltransferase [Rhodocyclaceae bacterium]MBL0076262.1 nicotinate (nicotinamide) nucleotide adenylyltransferase [Rhodocyclaceae bacterium]MBP6109003.1 nicotinate-nucleotide adenylyltransferase [Rhodocyclaceae bacterium]MBP6280212.1 nicotinate-nucleotide adenylyltransferase [Rhodocyclaceae bacterium]